MKPKPFLAQSNDWNEIYSNSHSTKHKQPGASTLSRKREIDLIMFNIRENMKTTTKPRPKNTHNVNSTSFNGRATPTGRNVNVSIAQSIITQNIYDLNSLSVAQDTQGRDQSTTRENDSAASVSEQQQGNQGKPEDLLTNANIEKFLNDPKSIDLFTKIHSTPKNGSRTGNTAVRSRKVHSSRPRVNKSMQINTDDMGNNDYKIFPNSNRTSDLVLRQLAMYLNQNTSKTPEVGINTQIPHVESSVGQQIERKNVDKSTRATSSVRTPNNYMSNNERFRPKYIDSIINRSLNMSPQRATPVNKGSNNNAKQLAKTAGNNENMVSNLIGNKTNELGAITMKPKPAPLVQLERVMTPDSGTRVRTPKLMHEEGRVSSSRVIRGIYRIRNSSMMSFDDKSEEDMSQEDDKTKSLSTQPDKEQKLDGDVRSSLEGKLPNKKIAHRRLFSSVPTDRRVSSQTTNTPSASRAQESKRETNLSFTHTSGFTSPETKLNRTMMEGFQKTWEDSKKQILQGKIRDATFLNFEQRGGKIQSRSKGGAFTLAIRRPLFEGEKTPGPGDYRIKIPMNKTAFAFGRDRKFDILGLPFVNEINKRYDPTRFL